MQVEPNLFTNDLLCSINPYIRLAWYDTMAPHTVIAERVIYDYEIVLIKSGIARITVENESYEAKCGDIFFFKPGQRHSFLVYSDKLVQPHIHFDFSYKSGFSSAIPISFKNFNAMTPHERDMIQPDITESFFSPFPSYIRLGNPLLIEQMIFDVINAYNMPGIFPEIRLKGLFFMLLVQLLCEIGWLHRNQNMQKNEWIKELKLYLEHHMDRSVSLKELSQLYHVDKSYISRIFSATYGISPIRYHLLTRIEKAKDMIIYTNLSLTSISEQTGFNTLQDFSRTFRRVEGVPPSALRRQ